MRIGTISKVVMAVLRTREEELVCDECFERLDHFVEMELSGLTPRRRCRWLRTTCRSAAAAARNSRRCSRPCGRKKAPDRSAVSGPG